MPARQLFQLMILAAIWGSSYLFMKMVAPTIGVLLTIGSRITIAAVVLLAAGWFGSQLPSFRKNWRHYTVLGVMNLALPFALITWSVIHLNASMSAILNATTPLFTLIMARIWLKEKLTPARIAGIMMGITGIVVLVGWIPVPLTVLSILAMLSSVVAAMSYGIGTVYTRVNLSGFPPMQIATGQLSIASLLLFPLLLINGKVPEPTPSIIWPVLILGILCTAIGYTLFFNLIATAGSVKTSMVTILVPVFSIIWSVLFLDEKVSIQMLLGLLMIITGLMFVTRRV